MYRHRFTLTSSGVGKVKTFDARQRIQGNGVAVKDARSKLTQKRSFTRQNITGPGPGDARANIKQKLRLTDARQKITSKKASSSIQVASLIAFTAWPLDV